MSGSDRQGLALRNGSLLIEGIVTVNGYVIEAVALRKDVAHCVVEGRPVCSMRRDLRNSTAARVSDRDGGTGVGCGDGHVPTKYQPLAKGVVEEALLESSVRPPAVSAKE